MLIDIINRAKLLFQTEKELRCALHEILGFYPTQLSHYKTALKHRSLHDAENNERLEFLGDAVLGAAVGDLVYKHFKNVHEGKLTQIRSRIVSRESLGRVSHNLGLDRLVRNNLTNDSSHNSYMAGNAFEALVGAIYLDRGYNQCLHFIECRVLPVIGSIEQVARTEDNHKSRLLEWTQKRHLTMRFDTKQERDPDPTKSSPIFTATAFVNDVELGKGKGYSKKQATQEAARNTLMMLRRPETRSLLRRQA